VRTAKIPSRLMAAETQSVVDVPTAAATMPTRATPTGSNAKDPNQS
jgi:hypothetical protein